MICTWHALCLQAHLASGTVNTVRRIYLTVEAPKATSVQSSKSDRAADALGSVLEEFTHLSTQSFGKEIRLEKNI